MPENPYRYALPGNQVEPTAALWLDNVTHVRVPALATITAISESDPSQRPRLALNFEADFPLDPATPANNRLEAELQILLALQAARGAEPYPEKVETEDAQYRLTPLSRFVQLQPVPFGAIFDRREHGQIKIQNILEQRKLISKTETVTEGRELARMFESETPGLYHRHALNWLFFNRADVSPPRHARVWMALDVAIYSALGAAWHYKWLRNPYSRLLRPYEYDDGADRRLRVLFDRKLTKNGQEHDGPRPGPQESPGTPRHPAWPSGHSTYSAAASHLLEYFFSPETLTTPDAELYDAFPAGQIRPDEPGWIASELRRLADNIGQARLWAGVHWISDHVAGQKVGRSAAQAVIDQLEHDCVPDFMLLDPSAMNPPPNDQQIAADAMRGQACAAKHDEIDQPQARGAEFRAVFGTF